MVISARSRYAAGTEFRIGRIDMVANTGTYLDTPAHRFDGGFDPADIALTSVAGLRGVVVDASQPAITADLFDGLEVAGAAVILRTGWSRHWATETYGAGTRIPAPRSTVWAGREHLTGLEQLDSPGFELFAVPVKVRGMGTFPVRAFARWPG